MALATAPSSQPGRIVSGSPWDLGASSGPGAPPAEPRSRAIEGATRAVVRILGGPAGRGFLVDARGYVLTHDHAVGDMKGLQVALADGRTLPVQQVWRDQLAGVAVLKIDGARLPVVPLGESGGLRVGDAAIVVGGPVAAPSPGRATVRATGAATGGNLAIDAPISSEHTGAPLFDLRGQVIGIATGEGHVTGDTTHGGFAIPIDRAKPVLRRAQATTAPQPRPGPTPAR